MTKYGIPKRFSEATMNSISPEQFTMVYNYAENLRSRIRDGEGLILSGPPGVGKTWAMAGLTQHYTKVVPRADYVFITAPEFFDAYNLFRVDEAEAVGWDSYRAQSFALTAETVHWLVINDLGKEYRGGKLSEQIPHKLGKVLRSRSERNLITHMTTNLTPTAFKEAYGDSIASLVSENTTFFTVTGPDRRKGN